MPETVKVLITIGVIIIVVMTVNKWLGCPLESVGITNYLGMKFFQCAPSPSPTSTPAPKASPSPSPAALWSIDVPLPPFPTPSPIPLPTYTCPQVQGMFWLPEPNRWYPSYYGFALAWDMRGGFYVWDPRVYDAAANQQGMRFSFPDFYPQATPRNTWMRVPNTPFNVCIESMRGYVYGQYAP